MRPDPTVRTLLTRRARARLRGFMLWILEEPIDVSLRTARPLPDYAIRPTPRRAEDIIDAVATYCHCPREVMFSRSRQISATRARWVAMALVRTELGLSLPATGRIFDRDHTTVLHALRKVATDAELSAQVAELRAEFSTGSSQAVSRRLQENDEESHNPTAPITTGWL